MVARVWLGKQVLIHRSLTLTRAEANGLPKQLMTIISLNTCPPLYTYMRNDTTQTCGTSSLYSLLERGFDANGGTMPRAFIDTQRFQSCLASERKQNHNTQQDEPRTLKQAKEVKSGKCNLIINIVIVLYSRMADPDIPLAYGTPVAPTAAVAGLSTQPSAPPLDLRAATAIMGGSSSRRVMLPQQNNNSNRNVVQEEKLSESVYQSLAEQGYTRGLAESLLKNKVAFPLSIWIVDNSGSMNTQDGHRLVTTAKMKKHHVRLVECTRWAEMQQTVSYHAELAALLKTPTVFRMLNDPGRVNGPQQFSIAERSGSGSNIDEDLAIAQSAILNTSPGGVTPLTQHILEIRANILELEPTLRANGTKVSIVLATDGTPTDSQGHATDGIKRQFVDALRSLEGLPVWLVIRLCTDDDTVVDFWNGLDNQLELSLEVLDDFAAEAQEVHEHNKWLNYGLPIHRIREKGFHHRLFDLLDERRLSIDELREFFRILFGDGQMDGLPDPQEDWKEFYDGVTRLVMAESKQWNPVTQRMEPWIDLSRLKRDYGPRSFLGLW